MQTSDSQPIVGEYLTRLDDKGIIEVSGEDRIKYLQGQITADIETLDRHHALLGCHCDFKGKTWNVFYAAEQQDNILLISPKSSIPRSLSELKKYGVFAKVDIQDSSEQWVCLGGTGERLETLIADKFADIPFENQQVFSNENGLVMALTAPQLRYLLILTVSAAEQLINQYGELSPQDIWEVEDIQAGIAQVSDTTVNEFVPQMMNLHVLDAISFSKGCYMGQEVVARTKYLGKNKRAAFILKSEQAIKLNPGDTLESQVGENWRRGGTVLRSASINQQSWVLAVLPNDSETDSVLRVKEQPEVIFRIQPLPYPLN